MMANPKLRKWLNHKPRPAWMLCDETRIDAPNSDRGWAEVAEAIEQLAPTTIKCFAGDGKLLRAKPFEYFFPSEEPAEPAPVVAPAERSELSEFAHLLADAHKSAGANYEPLLRAAMEFNTNLAARLTRTEQELDRARQTIARQAQEIAELLAEPAAGGDGGMVEGMLQGALAAAQQAGHVDGSVTPIQKGKKS